MRESPQVAAVMDRPVAPVEPDECTPLHRETSLHNVETLSGDGRGTSATRSFRALANVEDIRRQGGRFLAFVSPEPNTGCHLWTGSADPRYGYGQFRLWPAALTVMAPRVAWVLECGRLPERIDVHHRCRERLCVNPRHLEAIPHAENIRRRDEYLASIGTDNWAAARAAKFGAS